MRFRSLSLLCFCIALRLLNPAYAQENIIPTITVMADRSLTVPITLLARRYALTHHLSVSTVFGSTKNHIKKIEDGEDANVLIAARAGWIDTLQQKGLIDVYSRSTLARNRLVLAGSEFELRAIDLSQAKTIKAFTDQPSDFVFGIGNEAYTAEGSYGAEALSSHRLQNMLEPHYTIFRNMYQLLGSIRRYHSIGIVFRTDALLFPEVKEMTTFAKGDHAPILYQGVVIAGDNMTRGREFLMFLKSDEAIAILKSFGFDTAI